ncbi:MAG: hypothetical protein K2Q24_10195 [Chitinophagaceae bacterium]|jgi:hypothetical protein|nr:hypothetical protein [Chitinophagaceae bacterium]
MMKAAYLFFLLLFVSCSVSAQFNQLILRKNGIAHKRYTEGSVIHIKTKLGLKYSGVIYLIQNDSIYFSDGGIHKNEIIAVLKKQPGREKIIPFSNEAFLYTNMGIPLFVAGLVISGEPFVTSLIAGVTLVYAPILLYNIKRLITNGARTYPIGKKYDLHILDLHPAEKIPDKLP